MALFRRKRDTVIGDDGTVNDVLLRALLNGETIDRGKAMTIPVN